MRNWKITKWKERPEFTKSVPFTCLDCMNESDLDVGGNPIAQLGQGVVFDIGGHSMPDEIECPHCRRRKEIES